jgi:NAD(P)H dehydrogenase (quinone)
MNHLIVYCHPNPASFSAALKDRVALALQNLEHSVCIRDLYAQNYNPILSQSDFENFARRTLPEDAAEEQRHIAHAEVLHFVYPLWWTGLPAMLKGYIERTFTPGFAYRWGQQGREELLTGKRALFWTPHGNTQAEYNANGMYDSMQGTIHKGILEYVGIEVVHHAYFPDIRRTDLPQRQQWLDEVEARLKSMFAANRE